MTEAEKWRGVVEATNNLLLALDLLKSSDKRIIVEHFVSTTHGIREFAEDHSEKVLTPSEKPI